jgi:glycosyltransferase involved in cell wall biosynthesis
MNFLISIITISYNDKVGIEKTIQSVLNQSYVNVEYIVIDGDSTDGTIDVIKKYENKITSWISEKDSGISDAFNKGVNYAKGDWLIFMNSGDVFYSEDSLKEIVDSEILNSDLSLVYFGKTILTNDRGNNHVFGNELDKKKFTKRMTIPHQSTFFHPEYFKKYGLFDTKFKIAMDYELLLRSKRYDYVFIDKIISQVETGGISQKNVLSVFKEYLIAKLLHLDKSSICLILDYFNSIIIFLILKLTKKWKI